MGLNKWAAKKDDDAKADDAKDDKAAPEDALDSEGLSKFYADLVEKYPLESVEDSHDEDDWAGWAAFNKQIGDKIQIVGDDLLVTNPTRIQKAIEVGEERGLGSDDEPSQRRNGGYVYCRFGGRAERGTD